MDHAYWGSGQPNQLLNRTKRPHKEPNNTYLRVPTPSRSLPTPQPSSTAGLPWASVLSHTQQGTLAAGPPTATMTPRGQHTTPTAAAGTSSAAAHDDQDLVTLDGVRDAFFVAHRACERFSKVLGAIAQKLQDSKADDPWLTEVCGDVCLGGWRGVWGWRQ